MLRENQPQNPMSPPEESGRVMQAVMKLYRAMRRCPPDRKPFPFPPAVGRLLLCVSENDGISSRELCEALDLRPSSLSEMLARAEQDGWLHRRVSEEDRRLQQIFLSEKGRSMAEEMKRVLREEDEQQTACFTPEEKAAFTVLCNKLSAHLEELYADVPAPCRPSRPFPPEERGFPGGKPPRRLPPEGRIRS